MKEFWKEAGALYTLGLRGEQAISNRIYNVYGKKELSKFTRWFVLHSGMATLLVWASVSNMYGYSGDYQQAGADMLFTMFCIYRAIKYGDTTHDVFEKLGFCQEE